VGDTLRDYEERFTPISLEPMKVHLLSFVYVPEEEDADRPWYVADPFGLGASPSMAKALDKLKGEARDGLRSYLDSITGAHLTELRERQQTFQLLVREEATKAVDAALPHLHAEDDGPIREALIDARMALLNLPAERPRRSPRDTDPIHLRLRQSVEAGLGLLLRSYPPIGVSQLLEEGNKEFVQRTLKASAVGLGFPEDAIPWAVIKTRVGVIRYISEGNQKGQVRGMIATCLLHGAHNRPHPMGAIAALDPQWLDTLDRALDLANEAVHGAARQASSYDDIEECVTTVESLMRTLLEAIANPEAESIRGQKKQA